MNETINSVELAKLLKEKGYSERCKFFFRKGKYDKNFRKTTSIEYDSDSDCIWDWNLNGGSLIKTIPYPNESESTATYYSAPTIADVVMWLYEKHGIWTEVSVDVWATKLCNFRVVGGEDSYGNPYDYDSETVYNTPTEAYEAAIKYTLNNLI